MKNKRNVLIAFILICCLCLSIGYAALTDTLYIDGKASVNVVSDPADPLDPTTPFEEDFNNDVHFTNSSNTSVAVIEEDQDGNANDLLTITVPDNAFSPENKTVTYYVDIINESTDYDAKVKLNESGTGETSGNNFSYEVKWTDGTTGEKTIAKNDGIANVTITITLITTPTEDIPTEIFAVTYTATAVATVTPTP